MTYSSRAFHRYRLACCLVDSFLLFFIRLFFSFFFVKWPAWSVDSVKTALDSENVEVLWFKHVGDRWPRGFSRFSDLKLIAGKTALQLSTVYLLSFCSSAAQFPSLFGSPFFFSLFLFASTKQKQKKTVRFSVWIRRSDDATGTLLNPCSQRFRSSDENL